MIVIKSGRRYVSSIFVGENGRAKVMFVKHSGRGMLFTSVPAAQKEANFLNLIGIEALVEVIPP